jgi:hypothetical protein
VAKTASYLVRTRRGEKGPYTLRQIKEAIRARSLSTEAEYRKVDGDEWQPVKRLTDQDTQADAKARAERIERAPDLVVPVRPGALTLKNVLRFGAFIAVVVALLWWRQVGREEAMGKPCRAPEDCASGASCLYQVDADRKITEGYCTFPCNTLSGCKSSMVCDDAVETGSQSVKWDGTFGKGTRVCLKR